MKTLRPGDFLVFLIILILSFFSFKLAVSKKGSTVTVNASKNEYVYSLNKNGEYEVEGHLGITKFEIKDGKVRITDSPCPNKTCVKQGWGSTLVCLPNDVIITLDAEGGYDAIAE